MEETPSIPIPLSSPRPSLSSTKKKQKKLQEVLVHQLPRKNPQEIRQNGKMDKSKKPHEPLDLDEEEIHEGIEKMKDKENDLVTCLLKYVPL